MARGRPGVTLSTPVRRAAAELLDGPDGTGGRHGSCRTERTARLRHRENGSIMAIGRLHIGTSGWVYRHWLGPFYPKGTKGREQLGFYAERFDTVEVNGTFYP